MKQLNSSYAMLGLLAASNTGPVFILAQYKQADVLYNRNGTRKLGHLNRSGMYEECQFSAMEGLSYGVSPVPIFLSSDTTVICKKMGGHPIIRESLLSAQF